MIIKVDKSNLTVAAEIHSDSWKKAHSDFCKKDFVEMHTPERQEKFLQGEIDSGKQLYMLVADKPVGIVSTYKDMIENLYVLSSEQHKGYGTELLNYALEHCSGTARLWVLDNNIKALSLYTKHGFLPTGNKHRLLDTISEIEMMYGK